jgi:O-methyltransferase involved in polyketide biosynthesis
MKLRLNEQVAKASRDACAILDRINSNDPVRDWYQLELQRLSVDDEGEELPLEEANARLGALRQLLYLIRQHSVRLQNPDYEEPVKEFPDSFLTVQARTPANVLNSARDLGFTIDPELLHDPASENEQFDPVSPTAKVVAYLRGLDRSLKITTAFSPETDGELLLKQLGITDPETRASMAVLFQSRYHAMNAAISGHEHTAKQIIEFAAGISPRGYQWARMSPGTIYVESDLPQLMIHKAKLVRNACMAEGQRARGVHHCCAANVLDRESVFRAIENLDSNNAFTIATEGLLLYFGQQEMEQFFSNVREILIRFPHATWVTDLVSKSNLGDLFHSHPGVATSVKAVFSQVRRAVVPDNPFNSDACILDWLARFGLEVESCVELQAVTSTLKMDVDISNEQRQRIVGNRKIWRIVAASQTTGT